MFLGWDGCLLGNIDLLGISIVNVLAKFNIPILHHLGFVDPPYPPSEYPSYPRYSIASASNCVRDNLQRNGFKIDSTPVIYPGVREDLFGYAKSGLSPSIRYALALHDIGFSLGSSSNPLKLGYAGLIMASKGLHTLIQAVIILSKLGYHIHVSVAGSTFQKSYKEHLVSLLSSSSLNCNFFFLIN